MPRAKKSTQITLSDGDLIAIAEMVYAENGLESEDVIRMTIQTAFNRLMAGRPREFGSVVSEVLEKGYYAVSKETPEYLQAKRQCFPIESERHRFDDILDMVRWIYDTRTFGEAMFYFRPHEEAQLKKKPRSFNFEAVRFLGVIGPYNVYSY